MAENQNIKSPQPKYDIRAENFINAVLGASSTPGNGLRRLRGREIIEQDLFEDDFFNLDIIDNKSYVVLDSVNIIGDIDLYFENNISTESNIGIIFYNSSIPEMIFNNATIESIQILNTYINGDITFTKKSNIGNISILKNSYCGDLIVNRSSKCKGIKISEHSLCGDIWVRENSLCGDIEISEHSKSLNILISEKSISGFIEIHYDSGCADIEISKNSFCQYVAIFYRSKCDDLLITDCSICGDIEISKNSKSGDIEISDKSQTGDLEIIDSSCQSIKISENFFNLKLYNANIPLMIVEKCAIHEIIWRAGTKGELYISNCQINFLNLNHSSILKDAIISIVDCKVFIGSMNKLVVQGVFLLTQINALVKPYQWIPDIKTILEKKVGGNDLQTTISIEAKQLKHLNSLEDIYNKEIVYLKKEISKRPLWRIANSSLGKTEITGCNFLLFIFEFRDSKILDTFISGTLLPKNNIQVYHPSQHPQLDNIDSFEQKILVYNQLKKIFENQGNIVEATWYHSKAMENQQNLIRLTNKKFQKKWYSNEGFNRLNFWLNKISNNHGENWRRALAFVLIVSLLIYSLYYMSLFYKQPFSFNASGRFVGNFFSFLNITRREDFLVSKEKLTAIALFLDFFGRIATGFGIYQLIAAFRRHGRK